MSDDGVDFETLLELYRDERRRATLAVLLDERRALTVNDLAKTVVKHTRQESVTEASGDILTQIHVSLHHVHLPKLTDAGLVEYDPDRRLVEPTAQLERIQPQLAALIEADPEFEPPLEL